MEKKSVAPFLKWAGGKRWFIHKYSQLLPQKFNRYIEPFLGGGSVYFHLQPKRAILGDINADLIYTYQAIKTDWQALESLLNQHQAAHSDEYYYDVRSTEPSCKVERAARFIYLNRTCFNGIYRVNRQGTFNVPRGTKNTVIQDTDDFAGLSKLFKGTKFEIADFEVLINKAKENDLVFADPPYTVRHNMNGFIKYNEKLFSWDDQERLARALSKARERGVQIIATNANHASVRELYSDYGFQLQSVSRYSSISASANSRNQYEELVVQ